MNLSDTDFQLFGIPDQFTLNMAELDAKWKALQREVHPDKFASQGASAQRLAMQWSVRINEAYKRLKDPLKRAAYLCELRNAAINAENNTAMPAAFLMQQIEWRENLDDAANAKEPLMALQALMQEVENKKSHLFQTIEVALDQKNDAKSAVDTVRSLMFIERFELELEDAIEQQELKI